MVVLVAVALLPDRQAEMGFGRMVVYGSLILLGSLLVLLWVIRGRTLANRLQSAETDLEEMQERMAAIFRLSHRFANAQNEADVIDIVLRMCVDVVRVKGAIFVPLDDRSYPLPAQMLGDFSGSGFEAWAEHLAVSQAREQCAACQVHQAGRQDPCPIMEAVPVPDIEGIHCFPLRRGDQNFGLLNLYLEGGQPLDPEALAFLSAMIDEMGMAIEAVRLRERDLSTGTLPDGLGKSDGTELLRNILESLAQAVDVPYAHLCMFQSDLCRLDTQLTIGNPPIRVRQLLETHAHGPMDDIVSVPIALNDDPTETFAFLARPLRLPDGSRAGSLVLSGSAGKLKSLADSGFTQAIADQIAMTARYTQMVRTVEFHAVLEERARLAREIHDGMAQTLGFLKLIAAQLENYLSKGDLARINQLMQMSRTTLAEAYVDARQAIDGLRITPMNGFNSWVRQAAEDFIANSGLSVTVEADQFPATVPPEVQAQLIRIVQEALTNIRKHADASQVWIKGGLWHGDLVLEVIDDGAGFEPGDVIRPSRHGLRGMQERAELVEAEFQVISQPGKGTTVRVRLPADLMELSS